MPHIKKSSTWKHEIVFVDLTFTFSAVVILVQVLAAVLVVARLCSYLQEHAYRIYSSVYSRTLLRTPEYSTRSHLLRTLTYNSRGLGR